MAKPQNVDVGHNWQGRGVKKLQLFYLKGKMLIILDGPLV